MSNEFVQKFANIILFSVPQSCQLNLAVWPLCLTVCSHHLPTNLFLLQVSSTTLENDEKVGHNKESRRQRDQYFCFYYYFLRRLSESPI